MTISGIKNKNSQNTSASKNFVPVNIAMQKTGLFSSTPTAKVRQISAVHMRCLQENDLPKSEQYKKGIQRIAEKTGVSEEYLRDVLIEEERLRLSVYDDGVKENEEDAHGTYTIGFGHTGSVPGWFFEGLDYDEKKEYPITEENKNFLHITVPMAFELLMRDVEKAKKDAVNFMGKENFYKAPQSIQDAIVDIVFQKGIEKPFVNNSESPTYNIKKDLEREAYTNAAIHTIYMTNSAGLKKRNMFRLLYSIKDLDKQEQKKVLDNMNVKMEHNITRHRLLHSGFWGTYRALKFDINWANKMLKINNSKDL